MTTAVAHPNIALVKYWGKRDDDLILPVTGSLSLTLDVFPTTTTVTVDPALGRDEISFDGQAAGVREAQRITGASSHSKQCSVIQALISPPMPPVRVSSCRMSAFPVRMMVSRIAS